MADRADHRPIGFLVVLVGHRRMDDIGEAMLDPAIVSKAIAPAPKGLERRMYCRQHRRQIDERLDFLAIDSKGKRFTGRKVPIERSWPTPAAFER